MAKNLHSRGHVFDQRLPDFTLSETGMSRFFIKNRKTEPHWKKHLPVHLTGLTVCATVLVIRPSRIPGRGLANPFHHVDRHRPVLLTKAHYNKVRGGVRELDDLLTTIPTKARSIP